MSNLVSVFKSYQAANRILVLLPGCSTIFNRQVINFTWKKIFFFTNEAMFLKLKLSMQRSFQKVLVIIKNNDFNDKVQASGQQRKRVMLPASSIAPQEEDFLLYQNQEAQRVERELCRSFPSTLIIFVLHIIIY